MCSQYWFGDWPTGVLYQVGKESNVSTRYSKEQRYGKKISDETVIKNGSRDPGVLDR